MHVWIGGEFGEITVAHDYTKLVIISFKGGNSFK